MKLSLTLRLATFTASIVALVGCGATRDTSNPSSSTTGSEAPIAKTSADISTKEQGEFIERQKEEMRKQERELQDLRRQKFHDDYFRSQYQR